MEATSRPMLEPLTDLPVEEPPEGAPTPRPGRNPSTPGEAAARATEAPKPRPGEATAGDELIDPEELLGASQPLSMASERDTAAPAVTTPPRDAGTSSLDLVDPELDLSGLRPVLPRAAAAAAGAPTLAADVIDRPAPEFASRPVETPDTDARLSAELLSGDVMATAFHDGAVAPAKETKTSMASAAELTLTDEPFERASSGKGSEAAVAANGKTSAPAAAGARPASNGASGAKSAGAQGNQGNQGNGARASPAAESVPTAHPAQPRAPSAKPALKVAAPAKPASVTTIAPAGRSARASKPMGAPGPAAAPSPVASAAAIPTPTPTASPAGAASAGNAAAANAPGAMDRDFIARNQIVERYLSGRLPLKGATDFERFCKENPELLDELGLPERVNAGLRLLEASGAPEPWQEGPKPFWTKLPVLLVASGAAVALGIALSVVASQSSSKSAKIAKLQKEATEQPLDAATSTRVIRLMPGREGASNSPAVTIGGGAAELVDFKIDESRSAYKVFTVTIDRVDQGRVGVIHNVAKDSNGHVRISLNSSALGPGNYQFTIEGMSWRGEPEPDSWVMIRVQR